MPYEFDMPIIRGLLNRKQEEDEAKNTLNQLMTPQPPVEQPAPTKMPEQRGGKDMVNAAVENALRPAPNPYEVNLQRNIIAQKQAYGTAQNDSARQAASSQAELLRGIANSAGLDMSGYGSDVSLENSYRNLASREAQDIVEALQGQYAMSSDRYYERQYARALSQGLSLESAKRVAGAQAREYQANRVAYLQGVYNSYGRDGRVTNDYGNQFLAMMAQENPTLANFYTQVYPNQRDAYARDNQLEDKVLDQTNLLERLGITNDLNKDYATHQAGLNRENYQFQSGVNEGAEIRKEGRAEEAEQRAYQQKLSRVETLADYLGFAGEERKIFMAAAMGIKLPKSAGGKLDDKSIENTKKVHDMLNASERNILDQLKNEDGTFNDTNPELLEQLTVIRAQKRELENLVGKELGLKAQQDGIREYSDDDSANNESLAYLWKLAGGNMETYRQYVSNWLTESGVSPHFKEQYLKNLKAFQ